MKRSNDRILATFVPDRRDDDEDACIADPADARALAAGERR